MAIIEDHVVSAMIWGIPDDQRVCRGCNLAAKFVKVWMLQQDTSGSGFYTTLSIRTAAGAGLSTKSEEAVFVQKFVCTIPSNYGIADLYCLTAPVTPSAFEAPAESVEAASKAGPVSAIGVYH